MFGLSVCIALDIACQQIPNGSGRRAPIRISILPGATNSTKLEYIKPTANPLQAKNVLSSRIRGDYARCLVALMSGPGTEPAQLGSGRKSIRLGQATNATRIEAFGEVPAIRAPPPALFLQGQGETRKNTSTTLDSAWYGLSREESFRVAITR